MGQVGWGVGGSEGGWGSRPWVHCLGSCSCGVYVLVCVYTRVTLCTCVSLPVCVCMYVYKCVYVYVYRCVYMCASVRAVYLQMYVWMQLCVCLCQYDPETITIVHKISIIVAHI